MDAASPAIDEKTLARELDQKIVRELHELGESGTEELGTAKYLLRNKTERDDATQNTLDDFREAIGKWHTSFGLDREVLFFNLLRMRCYDLYEKTNAWDTIEALATAISMEIGSRLPTATGDQVLLQVIRGFLNLIHPDMELYQALNRGSNHSVLDSTREAREVVQEILMQLRPTGPDRSQLTPDDEMVRKELLAEANALYGVYYGIQLAAEALVSHESAIQAHYRRITAEADNQRRKYARATYTAGEPAGWPDHLVTGGLLEAQRLVGAVVRRLEEYKNRLDDDQGGEFPALSAEAAERAGDLASRLTPWESLLSSLAAEYRHSEPMRLPRVHVRYCFPFAVKVDETAVTQLSSALQKRIPGVQTRAHEPSGDFSKLESALSKRLTALDGATATVTSLELTDFWAGAGEGMYGGNRVELPALTDKHHPDYEWRAWIDLSRLENHCLCIERTLKDPTPHQLYKALRCPADYARSPGYRYRWDGRRHGYWRGLDDFAHDVILTVAKALAGEPPENIKERPPEYVKGHFQIIVLVDADVSATDIEGLYGAELLCTNVNRDAATLEEWVRYPAAKNNGAPEGARGNFGYKENWWSMLEDTTIFGVVGNPSWQATSYQEAAQYAASWTPRLLLWNRELMEALEQRSAKGRGKAKKNKKELADLRTLEQTVRRSVTDAHAEELCRLRADRRYLEWMLEAVGTTGVQEDLERRIHAMRLLISENERREQDRMDTRRNFFLGAIALFGVLNVSAVFAVLDSGNSSGLFKSHGAIRYELYAQGVLVLLVVVVFVAVELWRRSDR